MYIPLVAFFWALTAVFAYSLGHGTATDFQVLAFVNVLEQLVSAFYTQLLEQFNASSFVVAGFASSQIPIQQIQTIANDESIHAIALQSAIHALGGQVISDCTFNFSSTLTNVDRMVATARVVENVCVSAYLGAVTSLADPVLATAVAGILTVEARHQSILNLLSNATSIPQPFDVALTLGDVLAIADTFISGCKLGFSANPPLTVINSSPLQARTKLNLSSPALNQTTSASQLSCKIVTGGSNTSFYQPMSSCMVPTNVTGPMYVFVTDDRTAMNSPPNMNGAVNSAMVVAGPALLFVDQPDLIGSRIRPGSNAVGPATPGNYTMASTIPPIVSTTSPVTVTANTSAGPTISIPSTGVFTTTISPAQASALLSSLGN